MFVAVPSLDARDLRYIGTGICAMDYRGDDPYPTANTPGLIVDDVSRFEQLHICLRIHSLDFLGHA